MKNQDILTVGQLRKALEDLSDEDPIGLSVNGHYWTSVTSRISHGELRIAKVELCFADSKENQDIPMLIAGGPICSNGYGMKEK